MHLGNNDKRQSVRSLTRCSCGITVTPLSQLIQVAFKPPMLYVKGIKEQLNRR